MKTSINTSSPLELIFFQAVEICSSWITVKVEPEVGSLNGISHSGRRHRNFLSMICVIWTCNPGFSNRNLPHFTHKVWIKLWIWSIKISLYGYKGARSGYTFIYCMLLLQLPHYHQENAHCSTVLVNVGKRWLWKCLASKESNSRPCDLTWIPLSLSLQEKCFFFTNDTNNN